DPVLQHHPDGSDAAVMGRGTSLLLDWMTDTMEVERLQLRSVDDIPDRNLGSWSGEDVAATRATRAGDDARTPQSTQDLFDVVGGEAFLPRNLAPRSEERRVGKERR